MSKSQLFPTVAQLTASVASKSKLPEFVDLQGWNSDHKIFDELVEEIQPKIIVEVGTWKGRSAWHFAEASAKIGSEIYCVDTWLGGIDHFLSDKPQDDLRRDEHGTPQIYEQFLRNFVAHHAAGRIHPVRQTSVNGARALASRGLFADLIYIDGSHEAPDVMMDMMLSREILEPGGIIFGDDADWPGVAHAVQTFLSRFPEFDGFTEELFWIIKRK